MSFNESNVTLDGVRGESGIFVISDSTNIILAMSRTDLPTIDKNRIHECRSTRDNTIGNRAFFISDASGRGSTSSQTIFDGYQQYCREQNLMVACGQNKSG